MLCPILWIIKLNNSRVRFTSLNPAAREERPRFIPKSPPRVRVVTTVLHMPDVWDIHVRNLLWALGNPRIYMLTHRGVDLPEHPNIDYVYAKNLKTREEHPPEQLQLRYLYDIYDEINHLDFSDVDVVLFMQNDIFFTDKEKVAASVAACHRGGKIVLSLRYPWSHSIYDKDKKPNPPPQPLTGDSNLVYPRVWDGAAFVPARLVESAVADDIEFGYARGPTLEGGWLHDFALENWSDYLVATGSFRDVNGDPIKLVDLLAKGKDLLGTSPHEPTVVPMGMYWELMFEFSLYAIFKNAPFKQHGTYRRSSFAAHFQGARSLFSMTDGFLKRDLQTIDETTYRGRVNDTVFMLLMCGLAPMDELTKGYIRSERGSTQSGSTQKKPIFSKHKRLARQRRNYRERERRDSRWHRSCIAEQIDALSRSADQWMSPEELKRLEWATEVLKG